MHVMFWFNDCTSIQCLNGSHGSLKKETTDLKSHNQKKPTTFIPLLIPFREKGVGQKSVICRTFPLQNGQHGMGVNFTNILQRTVYRHKSRILHFTNIILRIKSCQQMLYGKKSPFNFTNFFAPCLCFISY